MLDIVAGATVTEALYQSQGKPALDKPVTFGGNAPCGNCLQRRDVCPASKILTSQFGSWENIVTDPSGHRWLCLPCASAYRSKDLRRGPSMITKGAGLTRPNLLDVRGVLARPIPVDTAVIVPLSGKKLVAARAAWGQIATDTATFTWTHRHHRLLNAATTLRQMGFTEGALRQPAPFFPVLVALPVDQHVHVRAMWHDLDVIRADKTLLPLFLYLSRKGTP